MENDWRMIGEWLENGWRMVGEWLENGWRMVGEWASTCLHVAGDIRIWQYVMRVTHRDPGMSRVTYCNPSMPRARGACLGSSRKPRSPKPRFFGVSFLVDFWSSVGHTVRGFPGV